MKTKLSFFSFFLLFSVFGISEKDCEKEINKSYHEKKLCYLYVSLNNEEPKTIIIPMKSAYKFYKEEQHDYCDFFVNINGQHIVINDPEEYKFLIGDSGSIFSGIVKDNISIKKLYKKSGIDEVIDKYFDEKRMYCFDTENWNYIAFLLIKEGYYITKFYENGGGLKIRQSKKP